MNSLIKHRANFSPIRLIKHVPKVQLYRPRSSVNDFITILSDNSYLFGKSIILFTMFYCSMQWYTYRSIRKEIEKKKD
jgi:hypothetical protein